MTDSIETTTSKPVLTIQPTTQDHQPAIFSITDKIWEGDDYIPKLWDKWVEEGGFYSMVLGDTIIGCLKATKHSGGQVTLEGMRIDPDYRGHGYATRALDQLLEIVYTWDYKLLRFATGDGNAISHHLGITHGFTQVASFYHRFTTREAFIQCAGSGTGDLARSGKEFRTEIDPRVVISKVRSDEIGEIFSFIQGSRDWETAHGLISYGWVFYFMTQEELMTVIEEGMSFLSRGVGGSIQGVLLAHESFQRPGNIDITWVAGDHETIDSLIRTLADHLILEENTRFNEIRVKTPSLEMAQRFQTFRFEAHSMVDGAVVYEKPR